MWFLDNIVIWLASARDWLRDAYEEVADWPIPFFYLCYPLYGLYVVFHYLTYYFGKFNEWVDYAHNWIEQILTEYDIYQAFKDYFTYAINAWNWILNFWTYVGAKVNEWWKPTAATVQGWISIAAQGLNDLLVAWDTFWQITFPNWTTELLKISSELSHFFTAILPTLFDIKYAEIWWVGKAKDIASLIDTEFKIRLPFYNELVIFFTNPFDWIKAHIFEPIVDDFNRGFDRGMKG